MAEDGFDFEHERARLFSIAYRMIGSVADAEDVVAETSLRLHTADIESLDSPAAWCTTVATRIAIDHLRASKRERPDYVGPWLPAPIVTTEADPAEAAELSDSLTTAFLLLLEELSPLERAAFLLGDVFGEPFSSVAGALDRSEDACRQLASRARRKLARDRAETTRPAVPGSSRDNQLIERFLTALVGGDESDALECLGASAVLVSDGGAERHAARRPVVGPQKITRFLMGLAKRSPAFRIESAVVAGGVGIVIWDAERPEITIAFDTEDSEIQRIYIVRNPAKLAHLKRGGDSQD